MFVRCLSLLLLLTCCICHALALCCMCLPSVCHALALYLPCLCHALFVFLPCLSMFLLLTCCMHAHLGMHGPTLTSPLPRLRVRPVPSPCGMKWPQRKGAAATPRLSGVASLAASQGLAAASSPATDTIEDLVGPVTETKADHLQRHGGGLRSCPRCRWYVHGEKWARTHGRIRDLRAGPRDFTWLSERPERWGGAWAVGCAICAASVARVEPNAQAGSSSASKGPEQTLRRLGSRWARYDVRARALQAEHVRQHKDYDLHKIATQAWLTPDEPVSLRLQASLEDDQLLAGSVPQVEDWLRSWRAASTPQSWAAAAQHLQTEHCIRKTRDRAVGARPLEQMARVMRETIREKKRSAIRQCSSISLGFDDRAGYKLVRFRCDVGQNTVTSPQPPSLAASQGLAAASALAGSQGSASSSSLAASQGSSDGSPYACKGILGCLQCLHGSSLEDFADDYAERTVRELLGLLKRFSTPLGDSCDEALYQKFLSSVRMIVADGALQKVACLLRQDHMPNVVLVLRDPAHFIRIACKEPLIRTGRFEQQHARLFGNRKALLKSIQFSDGLKARLEECQRLVVQKRGSQGGDVRHIMRHFSFAPQRFESFADPRRKYACCLHAIALLLADVAGDKRRALEERRRAEEALEAMTAQDILETGLAGDFGELCIRRHETPNPPLLPSC